MSTTSPDLHDPADPWAGDFDPFTDPDERRVLFATLDSFRQYRKTAHNNTTHRRRQAFYALPSSHSRLLSDPPFSFLDTLVQLDHAIDVNADIADAILTHALPSFGLNADPDVTDPHNNWHDTATSSDVNKTYSTIRQFYRDWSVEGSTERAICYDPILRYLNEEFKARQVSGDDIHVLVPGAGLGRLVFDICRAGFAVEGNEISYHQLLASSWILNYSKGPEEHQLYPFASHFSNLHSRNQQLRSVQIPDLHPATVMMEAQASGIPFGNMSMSAADFVVLYRSASNQGIFDAVATTFFIDTAPNPIRYIETIHHCLKANGVWINVGPLLWHFEDDIRHSHGEGIGEPGSVELTEEELLILVERIGFNIERREELPLCGYIQDDMSMLQNLYRPSHWIARKKE